MARDFSWAVLGTSAIDNSNTGALAGYLIAVELIMEYLARYVPGTTIFVRTLDDPLFNPTTCINDTTARSVFAGMDMAIVVDVLIHLYYGDIAVAWDCFGHYYDNTTQWSFCNKFVGAFNVSIPTGSDALYNNFTLQFILPLLQSFVAFMPQGNVSQSNFCFVQAASLTTGQLQDMGQNLGNIPNVTENPALPPLDFVAPQVLPHLTGINHSDSIPVPVFARR